MSNRPAGKLWHELSPSEVNHFFNLLYERIKSYAESSQSARETLSKYLFTANTGAAAGMFVLLQSAKEFQKSYLVAFLFFCFGAFWVGVSFLFLLLWIDDMTDGYSADVDAWGRGDITVEQIDAKNHKRFTSWKRAFGRFSLFISFLLLITGGIVAAIPFYSRLSG